MGFTSQGIESQCRDHGPLMQNMDLHSPVASLYHKVVYYLKAMDGFILEVDLR